MKNSQNSASNSFTWQLERKNRPYLKNASHCILLDSLFTWPRCSRGCRLPGEGTWSSQSHRGRVREPSSTSSASSSNPPRKPPIVVGPYSNACWKTWGHSCLCHSSPSPHSSIGCWSLERKYSDYYALKYALTFSE